MHNDFSQHLKKLRSTLRPAGASSGGKASGRRLAGEKRKPLQVPAGNDITIAQATSMLPPGWAVQHDNFNARWKVTHIAQEHLARSRSWRLYGYKDSFLLCCRYAWECAESTDGISCDVPGLFSNPTASASSSLAHPSSWEAEFAESFHRPAHAGLWKFVPDRGESVKCGGSRRLSETSCSSAPERAGRSRNRQLVARQLDVSEFRRRDGFRGA